MTAPKSPPSSASSSSNVRVVARIRPMAEYELYRGSKESVRSLAASTAENFDPAHTECLQVVDEKGEKRFFELDRVFSPACTQDEVYRGCGARRSVTDDIFRGFNCTILAYGQTGAGKTFTMGSTNGEGTIGEMDGMIPRACADLFETIQAKCDGNAKVELSVIEIYNEELRDLMAAKQSSKLVIRERLNGEVYVQGVEYRAVASPQDIGRYMQEASDRRVTASTAMNAVSSRSHAICTIRICGVLENDDKFSSKLTLVDLAGSERIKKTGAQGNRRQEGININKGLFVLGQVVSALSDAARLGTRARKPPYRDSKLTRILQDSLGGNSRTIMVACCSPADYNSEESVNTLRYATSARNIKNTATRNLVKQISPEEAAKLARENQLLKKQVAELQVLLQAAIGGGEAASAAAAAAAAAEGGSGDDQLSVATETTASTSASSSTASQATPGKVATTSAAAAEVPALHMEIDTLKGKLHELQDVEKENADLRHQVSDAEVEAEAARTAAAQLSDIMDKIKELQEDELEKKRIEYNHKKKEEQWIDFVFRLLQTQGQQLVKLWYDFELVQRLVTTPIVLKHVGKKTYAVKPKLGYQQQRKRWWDLDKGELEKEKAVFVEDPDEYQMQLLKEHIEFFKCRLKETQVHVEKECDDLNDMKKTLHFVQEELLQEIGSEENLQEAVNKESNLLDQLTTMLLQPATVLAAQVPDSVLGDGATTVTSKDIPEYIDMVGGESGGESAPGSVESDGKRPGNKSDPDNRKGWLFRWKHGDVEGTPDENLASSGGESDACSLEAPEASVSVSDGRANQPDTQRGSWFTRWRQTDDTKELAAMISSDLCDGTQEDRVVLDSPATNENTLPVSPETATEVPGSNGVEESDHDGGPTRPSAPDDDVDPFPVELLMTREWEPKNSEQTTDQTTPEAVAT